MSVFIVFVFSRTNGDEETQENIRATGSLWIKCNTGSHRERKVGDFRLCDVEWSWQEDVVIVKHLRIFLNCNHFDNFFRWFMFQILNCRPPIWSQIKKVMSKNFFCISHYTFGWFMKSTLSLLLWCSEICVVTYRPIYSYL